MLLLKLLCASSLVQAPNPAQEVIAVLEDNIAKMEEIRFLDPETIPLLSSHSGEQSSNGWGRFRQTSHGSSSSASSRSSSSMSSLSSLGDSSAILEKNGLSTSADGLMHYPKESYQLIDDTYLVPSGWKATGESKIPLPPGFSQVEPHLILPSGYSLVGRNILPDGYSVSQTGTIIPPGWKDGGSNAYAVPLNWKTKVDVDGKTLLSVPPKRHWLNRGKFPEGWKKDRSLKKWYHPDWVLQDGVAETNGRVSMQTDKHAWVHRPAPLGSYPSDILKEVTTVSGSKMLIPKYWEYRQGKVIPWGMKLTESGKVIPRDFLFDPTTNQVLPSKMSVQSFYELDHHMKYSRAMYEIYLLDHGDFTAAEGAFVEKLVKENPTARLKVKLGVLYYEGKAGFSVDYPKAISLFNEAAEQDDPGAFLLLGYLYSSDKAMTRDFQKSMQFYEKAAVDGGSADALRSLGDIYRMGLFDIKKDEVKALEYYRAASSKGSFYASHQLANEYHERASRLEKSIASLAFQYYQKSADQGSARAFRNLGYMVENGHGVPIDRDLALQYYQIAVEMGDETAPKDLANLKLKME